DNTFYGFLAYDFVTRDTPLFGVWVLPFDRSVNFLDLNGNLVDFETNSFALDRWFKLMVTADYGTGQIMMWVDGVPLSRLTQTDSSLLGFGLTDIGLYVSNYTNSINPRSIFTDNYKVEMSDSL